MVAVEVAPTSAMSDCKDVKSLHHDEDIAVDHLMEGKRCMLLKDYASAVESLALACEALSMQFGETASECADAYFHYGKALLELGRMESGVLGNALEGVPEHESEDEVVSNVETTEKMTEDEKEYVGVKVMDAIQENFEQHEEKINLLVDGHTKGDYEDDMEDEEESQDDGEEMEVEKELLSSTEKPMEEEDEHDEDPSNLQRAWEILELAKNIYTKRIATPMKFNTPTRSENVKKICDVLLALGEVSIENENYTQAVEDLNSCLEKRKDKLPNDVRQIAETQYQLGVALSYHEQFDEAIKYFNDSLEVLTNYLQKIKADGFSAPVGEIDDLEKLLPEIRLKIQDTTTCKEETAKAKKASQDGASGFSGSSKHATSIETKKK